MKKVHGGLTFVAALAAALLSSCEDPGINDFPYVERLVVGCVLDAGTDSVLVLFGRTLPLSEPYDPQQAALTGVEGRITHGSTDYALVQIEPGLYHAPGLVIASGETYHLTAQWQGKRVTATTRVPFPPAVLSSDAIVDSTLPSQLRLASVIRVAPAEVYGQTWTRVQSSGSDRGGDFTEIGRAEDADDRGDVTVSETYALTLEASDTLFAVVHAFDQPFYDFFISKGGNVPGYDDLLFRQIGGFVSWNVEGDGIGLFLGRAVTLRKTDVR